MPRFADICQMRILLVSATHAELLPTVKWLERDSLQTEHDVTGVGQLQTAYCLLKKIYSHRPHFIIQAGIGGSNDTKNIGSLFGIRSERLADLGVEEKTVFKSIFELNLAEPDHFPFSDGLLKNPYPRLMAWSGLNFLDGITVNEISTQALRIKSYKQYSSSFVESMEGAALHYICLMEKIPFLQIRSVSNELGERNKSGWKLAESLSVLNVAVINIIKKLQTVDEILFRI